VPRAGLNDNVNTIRNSEVKLSNGAEDKSILEEGHAHKASLS
jgi:hypothetical protein